MKEVSDTNETSLLADVRGFEWIEWVSHESSNVDRSQMTSIRESGVETVGST
jgi:hypothetical protein